MSYLRLSNSNWYIYSDSGPDVPTALQRLVILWSTDSLKIVFTYGELLSNFQLCLETLIKECSKQRKSLLDWRQCLNAIDSFMKDIEGDYV
jgi:hypothetical protein